MATSSPSVGSILPEATLDELIRLLWGPNVKEDVFLRWSQGMYFSEDEATALVQEAGGPCAVIAPIQSFLLKELLFSDHAAEDFRHLNNDEIQRHLMAGLIEIFEQVHTTSYTFVTYYQDENNVEQSCSCDESNLDLEDGESSPKRRKQICHTDFHTHLRCHQYHTTSEFVKAVNAHFDYFTQRFGVLSFLYSVLLTKGIEQVKNELEDPCEPLIDGIYGHGSQSLINLLLMGKAVSNVWDGEKEVSGLKLQGVNQQSTIGFLTQLEHLRYCEVGWFLKNPAFPIWVLGSETHLTVLFSPERALVAPESPEAAARRIFSSFDPEDSGFISSILLQDVLSALGLVCEPQEYIEIMRQKLDPDIFGIILINDFMLEFYPGEPKRDLPESFTMYHYNGIKRSNPENKIVYQEATVQVPEIIDLCYTTPVNPIRTCLQTKWPTIELQWGNDNCVPSLN